MISVIITTKDRMEFLYRAVKSIMENTTLPEDVIIVNDGGEIIKKENFIFNNDVSIEIINNICSVGSNKARNLGAERAKGKYLFFLDDDDAFSSTSIASRIKYFDDISVGLVYTGKKLVHSNNLNQIYHISKPNYEGMLEKNLLKYGNIIGTTSCVAIRKDVFDEVGKFDINLKALQDYDLWIRVSNKYKIKHDKSCNLIYTIHTDNKQISSDYCKYLEAGNYLYVKYKAQLKKSKLENDFLASRYLRVAMIAAKHSPLLRLKYTSISIRYKPSLKAIFLLLPISLSKKIRIFH